MELDEYFRLKQAYETKVDAKKKAIRREQHIGRREKRQKFELFTPKCINCKKDGGTTFRFDQKYYYAKCASASPCSLDVQIDRVIVSSLREQENKLDNEINRIKNEIIETKMDHLYKFTDEDNTLRRGEALRKNLQTNVDELVALRKMLYRNTSQVDKLETLFQTEVSALRAEEDSRHAARYVENIRPITDQLREAKYKYQAVEKVASGNALVQRTHTIDDYYR